MEKIAFLENFDDASLKKVKELCLTSVVINEKNLDEISHIKDKLGNISINVAVDIFANKEILEKFSEAKVVEAFSKEVTDGVCPNNVEVRHFKLEKIKEIISRDEIAGIFLNNFHFPTIWDKAEPEIYDCCYCQTCIEKFRTDYLYGDTLPEKLEDLVDAIDGQYYIEWLEFKCKTITSFVSDVKDLISESGKNIKIGVFAVPWKDKEYGSGNTRILGQDFYNTSGIIDFILPMLYLKKLEKDVEWVKETLDYYKAFGTAIIPVVFDATETPQISEQEVEGVLSSVLAINPKGVVLMNSFVNEPSKYSALKDKFCK